MNIIIHNEFDRLPESLRQYAINRVGKKPIKSMSDFEIKGHCLTIITKTFQEDGKFQVSEEMLRTQSQALSDELSGKFKDLTIDEVKEAFKQGIRGESGPYFGLCVKTYHQFLKHYYEKKERAEAMRVYLDLVNQEASKEPLTKEQKYERMMLGVKTAFNEYKESGKLPFCPAPYYDFLWQELKLINWTPEQKSEIRQEANRLWNEFLKEAKDTRRINTMQYKELLANTINNQTYLNKVKQVGLKKFFEMYKQNGFEI